MADGLDLTPIPPPTEQKLREVFKAAGGPGPKHISPADDELMAESILAVRTRRRDNS